MGLLFLENLMNFRKIIYFTSIIALLFNYSLLGQESLEFIKDPITDSLVLISYEETIIPRLTAIYYGAGTIIEMGQPHPENDDLILAKILTAKHVVADNVIVESHLGSKDLNGRTLKRHEKYDVALVQAYVSSKCKAIEIGEYKKDNAEVKLMGYPLFTDISEHKVWKSKKKRSTKNFVLLDSDVSPGASGGSLIEDNKVVGVISRGCSAWFQKEGKPRFTWPTVAIGVGPIKELLKE